MSDTEPWPNNQFPCHKRYRAEDEILDPLHEGRQYGARCPDCGLSYRLSPRTFDHPLGGVSVIEWALAYPDGETFVLAPQHPNFQRANAPLYPDPPWPSGWPQDPRTLNTDHRSLPAVTVEDLERDGYQATFQRLVGEAKWVDSKGSKSLVIVIERVVVGGANVVAAGEILWARRGWIRMRPDRVVLAHARSVDRMVVISRGFAFVPRPMDRLTIAPPPSSEPLGLFDTARDRP
jgi:hypothetical protein